MNKILIKSLMAYIVWSIILLFFATVGILYGLIPFYILCCIDVFILLLMLPVKIASFEVYEIICCVFISPVLLYMIWLVSMHNLIVEVEKNL